MPTWKRTRPNKPDRYTATADWPPIQLMTDSMPTRPAVSSVPESIRIAIEDLWRLSMPSEERIHASPSFRMLEDTSRSVYLGLEHSRLVRPPAIKVSPSLLSRALQIFFRWNGAPWFGDQAPSAGETAASLHRAFMCRSVHRTYLAPLERLSLEDRSFCRIRFVSGSATPGSLPACQVAKPADPANLSLRRKRLWLLPDGLGSPTVSGAMKIRLQLGIRHFAFKLALLQPFHVRVELLKSLSEDQLREA